MSDLISRQDAIEVIEQLNIPEDMCVFEIMSHIELEIMTLQSAQKWIPCSERLPEAPTFCLVTTDGSYNDVIDIAMYMSDGWHKASKVLAWMPLPKPWKGEEDG